MSKLPITISKNTFNNYEDVVKFIIQRLLKYTKKSEEAIQNDTINLLMSVKDNLVKEQNCGIYINLLNEKLHDVIINMIKENENIKVLKGLLSFTITITDNSELVCNALIDSDFHAVLIDLTIKVCDPAYKPMFTKSVKLDDIMGQVLLIVHNIARHDHLQYCFIEHKDVSKFKRKILQFLNSKDKRMAILAMAVLAWFVKEDKEDEAVLKTYPKIVDSFIEYINKGSKDKGRWYEGLHVWELLSVLKSLSTLEINNNPFMSKTFILAIMNILKSKASLAKEVNLSLDIVFNISLHGQNLKELKDKYKIEDVIKCVLSCEDDDVLKKAVNLIKILSNNETISDEPKSMEYDVFISYCHKEFNVMIKIVDELKKDMIKVWIDVDGIKGCGLDDMARGIEKSKALIIGVSHCYNKSGCCRLEAHYGHRLSKPLIPLLMQHKYKPGGWLGMLICSDTYIDVSDEEKIKNSVNEIKKQLKHKC